MFDDVSSGFYKCRSSSAQLSRMPRDISVISGLLWIDSEHMSDIPERISICSEPLSHESAQLSTMSREISANI